MNLLNESESNLTFENQKLGKNVTNLDLNIDLNNTHFGILNIKTIKYDISSFNKKQHIVFDVDSSGSMSDICIDNRTKMDHIIHTIINMIMFIVEHPELQIFISVFAFDDQLYSIIKNELITKENCESLVQKVKQIRAKNSTNIEKALTNSKDYIQEKKKEYNNSDGEKKDITFTHIFMTDGDANQGNTNPEELLQKCDLSISNIFIGFGIDHNAYLLKILSSSNKNKYYFVDALEKAGLVYGEILHSIIYKIMEDINITIKNGYIYDWIKNKWCNNMIIDDLVSDINKVYHIISENPLECCVSIEFNNYLTNEPFQYNINPTMNEITNPFEKFKYRQRTQELMFKINQYNFNNIKTPLDNFKQRNEENILLKENMNNLLEEMKNYCKSQQIEDSEKNFMKLLCDDIYMCLKTIDTRYGAMYSCSRQVSQGEQRSYSASQTPQNFKPMDRFPPNLIRSHAFIGNHFDNDENIGNDENYQMNFNNFHLHVDEIQDYTVSEDLDSNPYSNLSVLNLMRCCSSTLDDNKLFR